MSSNVDFTYIRTHPQLVDYCQLIQGSKVICFDTEFVSEDRYLPELCLLQIAAGENMAIVDTLECDDLLPFWNLICDDEHGHTTVVHAAREEFRFCHFATGKRPSRLFDTQIAAGLIGLEYPASYSNLVSRFLGKSLQKHETRTNWRHRPLSDNQLDYAIDDVVYLEEIHNQCMQQINKLQRVDWLQEEMDHMQSDFEAEGSSERWMKLSGIVSMTPKDLAVVRELWIWREKKASEKNMPARRVLRDDLLVELSKRGTSNLKKIRSIRGMDYGRIQKLLPEIADTIEQALQLPKSEWPQRTKKSRIPNLGLLGQFLATTLGVICREEAVAPNLVGSTQDLRALAAWRLGLIELDEPPRLFTGWRHDVIAEEIDLVLAGKKSLRITDATLAQPLTLEDN
ncbi:MAG: ribonuclease D [Pirellulaceae bacterium]